MADSVAKRAVRETREMTRLAVEAAKNELVEQLAPSIKEILERKLREGTLADDVDRLRRAADGYGETKFEEGSEVKDEDKKDESLGALFPSLSEADEMDEAEKVDAEMDEAYEEEPVGEGAEMTDEEFEISEAELEEMYKEALQLEVDVKKGFGDMGKAKDIGGVDPDKAPALSDPSNIADIKTGEHHWEDEEPPAKKNWTMEDIQRLAAQGLAENKALSKRNKQLEGMVRKMHSKLSEMNLFNTKVLHANKFLTRHKLNTEQKKAVVESLDRAKSIQEVKRIYSVLESTLQSVGALTETKRPHADTQKRRTSAAPNEEVLRESVDKAKGPGAFARLQQLAGLTNGKKA